MKYKMWLKLAHNPIGLTENEFHQALIALRKSEGSVAVKDRDEINTYPWTEIIKLTEINVPVSDKKYCCGKEIKQITKK